MLGNCFPSVSRDRESFAKISLSKQDIIVKTVIYDSLQYYYPTHHLFALPSQHIMSAMIFVIVFPTRRNWGGGGGGKLTQTPGKV